MKKIKEVIDFLRDSEFTTKVSIYFATKTVGDDFEPEEQNYEYANLNPITIRGYVTEVSPERLVWKQYGLQNLGAKEIVCEDKYRSWFENCNKIEIDGYEYQVFKDGISSKLLISQRNYNLIRVVVTRI